ncbi:MAG: type II secretion system secretin GspD [bacterium]
MSNYKRTFLKTLIITLMLSLITAAFAQAETKKKLITVNLQDVELANVVKFISDVTGKNFIYDESLRGKVTIVAPSKISADEAFALFTSVLNLKGYTIVPAPGNLLKIVPSGQSRTVSPEAEKEKSGDVYITKLIPLNYANADNTLRFLQPLISKDGHISVFGTGNYLLIVDTANNIKRLEHILTYVDKPLVKDEAELYLLKNGMADDIIKVVNDVLSKKGNVGISADDIKITADNRLNAIIMIGSSYAREFVKKLIDKLDVAPQEQKSSINVYFLENAEATELAKVLENAIKGLEDKGKQPADTKSKINITPDKSTNSLIISSPPYQYQNIVNIIKELDKRRKQVYVEAMIVEASIDKLKELGSKWRTIVSKNGEPVAITGFGQIDANSMASIVTGLSGFSVGGMGNFLSVPVTTASGSSTLTVPGFAALFNLNEFKDAVNVLSTPQILTSDNKEAEIVVGENVPFISKREQNTSTPNSLFNVIERKDVGITLRLTPQITEGEYVKLDLYQEISSLKQESNVTILTEIGPSTTKRSTKTSVVVKDKQTVVISGLMQEKGEEIISKVPFLGDLPLIGFLFRYKSYSTKKTNLLVFLTPHIIRDSTELAALSNSKKTEFVGDMSEQKANEAIIKIKPEVTEEELSAILKKHNIAIKSKLMERMYLIVIPDDKGFLEIKEILTKAGIIEYIEPNLKVKKSE